eukprot:gene4753-5931_t
MTTEFIKHLDINYFNSSNENELSKYRSLDLYLPTLSEQQTPPPLLVFVHGGFWVARDKKEYENLGEFFARNGIAVAVINYSLTSDSRQNCYPQHNIDLFHALNYLYNNVGDCKYNRDNIYLMGHSCGGHMISSVYLDWDHYSNTSGIKLLPGQQMIPISSIRNLIGLQGIYDVPQLNVDFPEYNSEIQKVFNSDDPKKWDSPQFKNPNSSYQQQQPKWMIIHSADDTWVNDVQAINFVKHLKETCQFKNVEINQLVKGVHFDVITTLGDLSVQNSDYTRELILNYLK